MLLSHDRAGLMPGRVATGMATSPGSSGSREHYTGQWGKGPVLCICHILIQCHEVIFAVPTALCYAFMWDFQSLTFALFSCTRGAIWGCSGLHRALSDCPRIL